MSIWISVDKLPNDDDDYLVIDISNEDFQCVAYLDKYVNDPERKWHMSGVASLLEDIDVIPTHWMPLPPPPKVGL